MKLAGHEVSVVSQANERVLQKYKAKVVLIRDLIELKGDIEEI